MSAIELRNKIILTALSETEGYSYDDLSKIETLRGAPYSYIRGLVMYILHNEGYTLTQIGELYHKDHATVKYWCNKWSEILSSRLRMFRREIEAYDRLEQVLYPKEN